MGNRKPSMVQSSLCTWDMMSVMLRSVPERTLCGVMSNTPKNSSAVLPGSWLCTDLETDWWSYPSESRKSICTQARLCPSVPSIHWLDLTQKGISEQCSNWGSLKPWVLWEGDDSQHTHTHLSPTREALHCLFYTPSSSWNFAWIKGLGGKGGGGMGKKEVVGLIPLLYNIWKFGWWLPQLSLW